MESAGLARGLQWRIAVVGLAAAAALAAVPAAVVERLYSARLYPPLQRILTAASNLTPIPAFDVLIVLATAGFFALAWRDLRSDAGAVPVAPDHVPAAGRCISYLAFLVAWGLNYRRPPPPGSAAVRLRPRHR